MTFANFLNAAWDDHAKDCGAVAARLPTGLALVASAEDVPPLIGLAVHVYGEHLGRWNEGLEFLDQVAASKFCDRNSEGDRAVLRGKATLYFCKGDKAKGKELAMQAHRGAAPEASTLIRALATASAALTGQKRAAEAAELLDEALSLAVYGPKQDDPAARALAITGNNLACELEERESKNEAEITLMKQAASVARKYWEISGTWLEVERAEYRLAITMVAAGEPNVGLEHAQRCLQLCESHNAGLFEHFFAHEARAKCFLAAGRSSEAADARNKAQRTIESVQQSLEYMSEQLNSLDRLLAQKPH